MERSSVMIVLNELSIVIVLMEGSMLARKTRGGGRGDEDEDKGGTSEEGVGQGRGSTEWSDKAWRGLARRSELWKRVVEEQELSDEENRTWLKFDLFLSLVLRPRAALQDHNTPLTRTTIPIRPANFPSPSLLSLLVSSEVMKSEWPLLLSR